MTWYLELLQSSLRGDWPTLLVYGLAGVVGIMVAAFVAARATEGRRR